MSQLPIYEIVQPDHWVVERSIEGLVSNDPGSPFSYALVDYQELLTDEEIHTYRRTYQVINDASRIENASLILTELHQHSQRLLIHGLTIHRNNKPVDALDVENISVIQREKSLESHITNNQITVSISVDDLRQGDHIEFSSTIIETQNLHPLMGKHFSSNYNLAWSCPVNFQSLRVINNSSSELTVLYGLLKNHEPDYKREPILPSTTFEVIHRDLKISKIPETAPAWVWENFIQITTKNSWPRISDYLYNYFSENGALDYDIDLNNIDQLNLHESNHSEDLENKAIKVIRFVQNNIRYKGENHGVFTHTPKNPSRTLKKRAGDCKDKSNLLVAMLTQLGIEASLVLVNTYSGVKIKSLNPSPYRFNHMIVLVKIEGKTYFVDPTIQKQAGNFIHMTELDYGYGLPLKDNGSELIEINSNLRKKVFSLEHDFCFPKNTIDQKLTITRTYNFHRADNMRAYFSSTEKSVLEENFLGWSKDDTDLNLEIIEAAHVFKDDTQMNEFIVKESYKIVDIKTSHKDKKIELLTDFYKNFPIPEKNNYPVKINLDGALSHTITVNYTRAPNLEVSKKEIRTNEFAYTDKVYTLGANQIIYKTLVTPLKSHVDSDRIESYKSDVESMRQRSVNLITHKSRNIFKSILENSAAKIVLFVVAYLVIRAIIESFSQ